MVLVKNTWCYPGSTCFISNKKDVSVSSSEQCADVQNYEEADSTGPLS